MHKQAFHNSETQGILMSYLNKSHRENSCLYLPCQWRIQEFPNEGAQLIINKKIFFLIHYFIHIMTWN